MDDMEQKLGAILGNPEMMSKIMSMAQSLSQSQNTTQPQQSQPSPPPNTDMPDLSMIQRVASFASQTGIDQNQQGLLNALTPYLGNDKIQRLEKAMKAAKMAQVASSILERGKGQPNSGR